MSSVSDLSREAGVIPPTAASLPSSRAERARVARWGSQTAEERFWSHVDRSAGLFECWTWTAFRHPFGYGKVKWHGVSRDAHRVAYEIAVGLIPAGLNVCHRCDNPPCCNPAHLFLGTQHENVLDMVAKGRLRGRHHLAGLTGQA